MFPAESPLVSPAALEGAFVTGLRRLLAQRKLAGFILCAANAAADATVREALEPELQDHWGAHARRYEADGCAEAGEEDRAVFGAMIRLGEAALEPTRVRMAGPWEVQFNRLRALRPPRVSRLAPESLHRPFDPDGFHFNRPFMLAERYWEGMLDGRTVSFYFNKYPFARHHTLLVPEREVQRPQFLDRATLEWACRLLETAARDVPDLLLAYNAFGAWASVNHLHFHLLRRATPLPIMTADAWPVAFRTFAAPADAWPAIERLHATAIGYNLLLAPGRITVVARARQGQVAPPPWSAGLAWYEMAGGFVVPQEADFTALTPAAFETALAENFVPWPA